MHLGENGHRRKWGHQRLESMNRESKSVKPDLGVDRCSGYPAQALLKQKRATAEKAKTCNKGAKEFYRAMMSAYAPEPNSMESDVATVVAVANSA